MSRSRARGAALCALAVMLPQCERARTELVVTVRSELSWGAGQELRSLAITVRRGNAEGAIRWQQTRAVGDGAGLWTIPLSFGLYPSDASDLTPVWLEVLGCAAPEGCIASTALVTQRAVLTYRAEQAVGLDMWLTARCRGVVCAAGETCAPESGACIAARSRDADLRPIVGDGVPHRDAEVPRRDVVSQTDAASDADATIERDAALDADATVERDAALDADAPSLDVGSDEAALDAEVRLDARDADASVGEVSIDALVSDVTVDAPAADAPSDAPPADRATTDTPRADVSDGASGDATSCDATAACGASCITAGATCSTGRGACARTGTAVCAPAVAVGGSEDASCALTPSGALWCWGLNGYGVFGIGSLSSRSVPVAATGISSAVELALGGSHHCVRLRDGTVRCAGWNNHGQLGNGTTSNASTFGAVSGLSAVQQVSCGFTQCCALTSDGAVWCWGENSSGQLGDDSTTDRSTPVRVVSLTNAVSLSVGHHHACAILQDRTASCWGGNALGQLGDGTRTNRSHPVPVLGFRGATQLSAGSTHTCARMDDGTVTCWGNGAQGQLGSISPVSLVPLQVRASVAAILTGAVRIASGWNHTCALLTSGAVSCWGDNNSGALGDGTTSNRTYATPTGISAVALGAGLDQTCVVGIDGAVRCWGSNMFGQLGDGTTTNRTRPVTVPLTPDGAGCSAVPGGAGVEVCNGLDDDCDGAVDEGLTC